MDKKTQEKAQTELYGVVKCILDYDSLNVYGQVAFAAAGKDGENAVADGMAQFVLTMTTSIENLYRKLCKYPLSDEKDILCIHDTVQTHLDEIYIALTTRINAEIGYTHCFIKEADVHYWRVRTEIIVGNKRLREVLASKKRNTFRTYFPVLCAFFGALIGGVCVIIGSLLTVH